VALVEPVVKVEEKPRLAGSTKMFPQFISFGEVVITATRIECPIVHSVRFGNKTIIFAQQIGLSGGTGPDRQPVAAPPPPSDKVRNQCTEQLDQRVPFEALI